MGYRAAPATRIDDGCTAGGSRCRGRNRRRPLVAGRSGLDAGHLEPGSRRSARRAAAPGPAGYADGHHDAVPGRPGGWSLPDHHLPAAGSSRRSPELVDWSGDGSHALFDAQYATTADGHHGRPAHGHADDVDRATASPRYTRPEGKALLLSTTTWPRLATGDSRSSRPRRQPPADLPDRQARQPVQRGLSLDAGRDAARPRHVGGPGADGQRRDSRVDLPIPGQNNCSPLRWWDELNDPSSRACDAPGFTSRLWLAPIDGGPPTALTAVNDGQKGPDLRDASAW